MKHKYILEYGLKCVKGSLKGVWNGRKRSEYVHPFISRGTYAAIHLYDKYPRDQEAIK
jgi:hypothetical protein